jgi:ERO1-like protein beta
MKKTFPRYGGRKGKLEGPKATHPGKKLQHERPRKPLQGMLGEDVGESCVVEYDDECDERDYCVPDDEGSSGKGDYVSLVDNPERFTGYAGEGAQQVWNTIYKENCFSKASFPKSASYGNQQFPLKGQAANELQSVMRERGRQQALEAQQKLTPETPFVGETGLEFEGECLEKRVFYRVISGMHSSISTHLCFDYLNQTTGEWGPNLQCYKDRLHKFPERVSNLYFNYALVLRAITKLGPYLQEYTFCSGDPSQDATTKAKVQALTTQAGEVPQIFDESLMFVNGEGPSLKEDFKNRFRNISRIMDCVGCDKCRLWGKIQTAGYGAALKVLFEFDNSSEDVPVLKRTELVALFNTLARISSSLESINQFRVMVESEETVAESAGHHHVLPHRVTKPHNVIPGKDFARDVADDYDKHDEEEHRVGQKSSEDESFADEFYAELALVWKAFKYIMRGWVAFPKSM